VRRIVAVIVMGVLKSRLGRTDAFAACFRAGRSWRIPDRRRTELERHEWIDSNRLAADRVVYQASESDHRAGEEMNWVGYPRRRDGPCARQPAVRNPYRMREKMSRSGAPPQAEVTKSLWSTEPASTKAISPGASVAGKAFCTVRPACWSSASIPRLPSR